LSVFVCVVGFVVLLRRSVKGFSVIPDRLEVELLMQLTREVLYIAMLCNNVFRVVFFGFFNFVKLLHKLIMSEHMLLLLHRFPLVLSEDLTWHKRLIFLRIDQLLDLIADKVLLIRVQMSIIRALHLVRLAFHLLIQLLLHDHLLNHFLLVVLPLWLVFFSIKLKLLDEALIVGLVFLNRIAHLGLIL
jgi:hypothetical protein